MINLLKWCKEQVAKIDSLFGELLETASLPLSKGNAPQKRFQRAHKTHEIP
jgi:hypothetical protein